MTDTPNKPLVIRGRVSDGAKKILDQLTQADREKIRDTAGMDYCTMRERDWGKKPDTVTLCCMFAALMRAGESEININGIAELMLMHWKALYKSYVNNVRSATEKILSAEKRAAARGDDTNVVGEDDFLDLCTYALGRLNEINKSSFSYPDYPKIYQRNGVWVEIREGDESLLTVAELNFDTFKARLNHISEWRFTNGETDFRRVSVPDDVARQVYAHPDKPVPRLRKVISAPMYTADAKLIRDEGFDPSGYFYAPAGLVVEAPPNRPTEEDVRKATVLLTDLFAEFEMDGVGGVGSREFDQAVLHNKGGKAMTIKGRESRVPPSFLSVVAVMLEQLVRPIIKGPVMPLLISKTDSRAGGGLLVDVIQMVVRGAKGTRPLDADEGERRKAVLAALLRGTSIIAWDNIPPCAIDSPVLASLFTEGVFMDRGLGGNREYAIPIECSFILTGIRPKFTAELTNRFSLVELLPSCAEPGKRTGWRHANLDSYVAANRGAILGALLVLVQNWIAKGRPRARYAPIVGRFESYTEVIGGILESANPHWITWLHNRDRLADVSRDETEGGWVELFAAWLSHMKGGIGSGGAMQAAELAALAETHQIDVDAGRVKGGEEYQYNVRSFGKALGRLIDRVFEVEDHGTLRLVQSRTKSDGKYPWYLERVQTRPQPAPVEAPTTVEPAANVVPMTGARGRATRNALTRANAKAPVANPFAR